MSCRVTLFSCVCFFVKTFNQHNNQEKDKIINISGDKEWGFVRIVLCVSKRRWWLGQKGRRKSTKGRDDKMVRRPVHFCHNYVSRTFFAPQCVSLTVTSVQDHFTSIPALPRNATQTLLQELIAVRAFNSQNKRCIFTILMLRTVMPYDIKSL